MAFQAQVRDDCIKRGAIRTEAVAIFISAVGLWFVSFMDTLYLFGGIDSAALGEPLRAKV